MATYDAFALGTAIGLATERIGLTLGPSRSRSAIR